MKKSFGIFPALELILSLASICAYSSNESKRFEKIKIIKLPLKNLIVIGRGEPASPDGIELRIRFSDGTVKKFIVSMEKGICHANRLRIESEKLFMQSRFGICKALLKYGDTGLRASYPFLSLPSLTYISEQIHNILCAEKIVPQS